jgi:acyl-CoA thioesterase FadM
MAHTYIHRLDIRYDECDVYGHLNNAVYLRYMQEAAFRASADVGLDAEAYEKMGRLWLIRGHDIEYLEPARAGETDLDATSLRDAQSRFWNARCSCSHRLGLSRSKILAAKDHSTGRVGRLP